MPYVFDPDRLKQIAASAGGKPFDEMCRHVMAQCERAYPGYVTTEPDWLFNLACGATGVMTLLHGSLTEYLIIFGSAVGTDAFSGRYHLDIWDFVITGEMWTYKENAVGTRVITKPGEGALLEKGMAKGYRILENTWMLEYGRGPVPTALPVGVAHSLVSGVDVKTVLRTFKSYGRATVRSLLKGKI